MLNNQCEINIDAQIKRVIQVLCLALKRKSATACVLWSFFPCETITEPQSNKYLASSAGDDFTDSVYNKFPGTVS